MSPNQKQDDSLRSDIISLKNRMEYLYSAEKQINNDQILHVSKALDEKINEYYQGRYELKSKKIMNGMIELDKSYAIVNINKKAQWITGSYKNEAYGQRLWDILLPEKGGEILEFLQDQKQDFCIFGDTLKNRLFLLKGGPSRKKSRRIFLYLFYSQKIFPGKGTWRLLPKLTDFWSQEATLKGFFLMIKELTDLSGIGIRIEKGNTFLFLEPMGFSQSYREMQGEKNCIDYFFRKESLSSSFLQVSPNGSFWTNHLPSFLSSSFGDDSFLEKDCCLKEGFLSFASIPILEKKHLFASLQLAYRKKDSISKELIDFLEKMMEYLTPFIISLLPKH